MDKIAVYNESLKILNEKVELLLIEMDETNSSLSTASKSSVGDKHETARAMIQLEQERLSKQITQSKHLLEMLLAIDPAKKTDQIASGSLVKTNRGYFFLSVGLGKIVLNKEEVFCLSPLTPMGQLLLGKRKGDAFKLNGELTIEEVS